MLFWAQCRYTEIAQRIFKYSDIQYTSLTPNKIVNSLIYRSLFYVNIYRNYKLSKNSPVFFGPPCIIVIGPNKTSSRSETLYCVLLMLPVKPSTLFYNSERPICIRDITVWPACLAAVDSRACHPTDRSVFPRQRQPDV